MNTVAPIEAVTDHEAREALFFGMSPINHCDSVQIMRPLARSGESLIYDGCMAGVGRVAVKVGVQPLVEIGLGAVDYCEEGFSVPGALAMAQMDWKPTHQRHADRLQARGQELEKHFGDRVVPESAGWQTLDFRGKLLDYCLRSQIGGRHSEGNTQRLGPVIDPKNRYQLGTIIRTQPHIPELTDPYRFSLSTRYAEIAWDNDGTTAWPEYLEATRDTVFADGPLTSKLDVYALLDVQGSPYLTEIVMQAEKSPDLAASLRSFLDSLGNYVEATGGNLVDVIGRDNIIFTDPQCIMVDGLYPQDIQPFVEGQEALQAIARGERPHRNKANQLINVVNFVRGMNIVALACGLNRKFHVPLPSGLTEEVAIRAIADMCAQQHGIVGPPRIIR